MSLEDDAAKRAEEYQAGLRRKHSQEVLFDLMKKSPSRPDWAIELAEAIAKRNIASAAIVRFISAPREKNEKYSPGYHTVPSLDRMGWLVEWSNQTPIKGPGEGYWQNHGFVVSEEGDVWKDYFAAEELKGPSWHRNTPGSMLNAKARRWLKNNHPDAEAVVGVNERSIYTDFDKYTDEEGNYPRSEVMRGMALAALVTIDTYPKRIKPGFIRIVDGTEDPSVQWSRYKI